MRDFIINLLYGNKYLKDQAQHLKKRNNSLLNNMIENYNNDKFCEFQDNFENEK